MDGLVAVVSAPKGSGGEAAVTSLIDVLAKDPNWNGGWYYEKGGITGALTDMRVATLKRYGIATTLTADTRLDAASVTFASTLDASRSSTSPAFELEYGRSRLPDSTSERASSKS